MMPVVLLAAALASPLSSEEPAKPVAATGNPQVVLETSKGAITIELYPDKAPKTVENFLSYVKAGHYDGTVFHRVIDGFMVQGGGFDAKLVQKPTRAAIQNEADNGLKNKRGTVAMARTGDPHSATAQFFINTVDNAFLDHKSKDASGWGYTVFGKVVTGMDVVDAIGKSKTGARGPFSQDFPQEGVSIVKAYVK
jgi:peptidyl-prolyl cis-trans isomerase B (cyclophilin B)